MGSKEFLEKSKQIVVDYFNSHADKTDQKQIAFLTGCIMKSHIMGTSRKRM